MERVDEQVVGAGPLDVEALDAIDRSLARIGTATVINVMILPVPGLDLIFGLRGRRGLASLPEHLLSSSTRRGMRQLLAVVDLILFLSIGPGLIALVLFGSSDLPVAVVAVFSLVSFAAIHVAYDRAGVTFGGLSEVLGASWLVGHWRSARRWNALAVGALVVLVAFVLGSAVHGPAVVGFDPANAGSLMSNISVRTTGLLGPVAFGALVVIEMGTLWNIAGTYSAMRDHVRDLRRDRS